MLTGRSSLCEATTIQIQQTAEHDHRRRLRSATAAATPRGPGSSHAGSGRRTRRSRSSPTLIVSTNAPSFFRPPISRPGARDQRAEQGQTDRLRGRPGPVRSVPGPVGSRRGPASGCASTPRHGSVSLIDDVATLRRPRTAAHGTSDAHDTRLVDVTLATPVVPARVQVLRATLPRCRPGTQSGSTIEVRPALPPTRVHRIVLAVVVSPQRRGSSEEASPSPVDGARLLSGLRVIPSRGFKSRRLRSRSSPVRAIARTGELRQVTGGGGPRTRPRGFTLEPAQQAGAIGRT